MTSKRIREVKTKLIERVEWVRNQLKKSKCMVDFETRCELDITEVGAYRYARHPSCEVLMASYNLTGNPKDTKLWVKGDPPPLELLNAVKSGSFVNAFNAFFEYCIWQFVCTRDLGWPALTGIEQTVDVQDRCRAIAIPGNLSEATAVMFPGREDKQKDKDGLRLIKMFSVPPYANPEDHPIDWGKFKDYCIQDTNAQLALDKILPELPPIQQLSSWMTGNINLRGVHVDLTAAKAASYLAEKMREKYNLEASKLSGGAFQKCTQRAKVKAWLADNGLSLPNMQGTTIDKTLNSKKPLSKLPEKDKKLRRMLLLYKIAGSTSISKFSTMMVKVVPETGRIHETLIWHKARTGRYAGAGVQFHNLPRPTLPKGTDYQMVLEVIKQKSLPALEKLAKELEVEVHEVLISSIRSVFTPLLGNIYNSADYSAIEARKLFWNARDEHALNIFRRKECLYTDMASGLYNKPVEDIAKDSQERFMGKTAILGAGYGCGGGAFARQVSDNTKGEIKLSTKESNKIVKTYRDRFPLVPKLWKAIETAAANTVNDGLPRIHHGYTFRITYIGGVKFLVCKMPSGHKLYYPRPRVTIEAEYGETGLYGCPAETLPVSYDDTFHYDGFDSYTNKWGTLKTYGGKLVENITQGGSGDLLVMGMLMLDTAGYSIVFSVHDEVVSEDDEDFGSLEDFEELMTFVPKWADGMPLASEGWRGHYYRK